MTDVLQPTDGSNDSRLDTQVITRAMLRSCTRIAVFACDRSFKLLYCNAATERLFRLDSTHCTNRLIIDLLSERPDEAEHITAVCNASAMQGYAEVTVRPPADRSMSMLLTIMPLIDDDGSHIGFLFHGMDVSAKRRAEEVLLHYQRAVEASSDLIAVLDHQGLFALANHAFLDINGLDRSEVIGQSLSMVFRNREIKHHTEALKRCLKGEEVGFEESWPGPAGDMRHFFVSWYPLKGREHDIRGAVMVTEDITVRKEAERRIQDALTEKEKLIESLTAALDEVKTLRGFIPICAHCKKVRDDQGYWSQVEEYISAHSDAEFSHGICPDCMEQYFPEIKSPELPRKKSNEC